MRLHLQAAAGACLGMAALHNVAFAQTSYGTVSVCYYSTECAFANIAGIVRPPNAAQLLRDSGEHQGSAHPPSTTPPSTTPPNTPVDAPAFQFTNTGSVAITSAVFGIAGNNSLNVVRDIFRIGTIKPGQSFVIVPGASNDKKIHPTGGFFTFNAPGTPLDTSDSGPNANTLKFTFTGKVGTQAVTSGPIIPGKFIKPSTDGTVAKLNFLGGPGNADGPCNDCYPITLLANITAAATATVPDTVGDK